MKRLLPLFLLSAALTSADAQTEESLPSENRPAETLPKPDREPGFHKGSVIVAVSGGGTFAAHGSLIEEEKRFDEKLRTQVFAGVYPVRLGNFIFPSGYVPMQIRPEGIAQLDVEYGISRHIGIGLTYMGNRIASHQQDLRTMFLPAGPGSTTVNRIDFVGPAPFTYDLYNGQSLLFAAAFHPLPGSTADPYFALRAGVTAFSTSAHGNINPELSRTFQQEYRGMGTAAGAALGMNIALLPEIGMRVEFSTYWHNLQAAPFNRATIGTYHIEIGFYADLGPVAVDGT